MKRLLLNLALCLVLSPMAIAATKSLNFQVKSFDEAAKKAKSGEGHLRFTVYAKKFLLGTSDVPGYVKSFNAQGEYSKETSTFSNLLVSFEGLSLDTDDGSRNEKMHEYVLGIDGKNPSFKTIKVMVNSAQIKANAGEQTVNAIINIRGKDHTIPLKLKVTDKGGKFLAEGSAKATLKGLELPDPSIVVAKLLDKINIDFAFEVK